MESLSEFISRKFGVSDQRFLEILRISHGAEGYLLGSISEQLFKEYAEKMGFEVLRIKEKPSGGYRAKNEEARGDFYIKQKVNDKDEWLVVECKGVKSNAEKRAGLSKKSSCKRFLIEHSVERFFKTARIYDSGLRVYTNSKNNFEKENSGIIFPKFSWNENNPGSGIPDLSSLFISDDEVNVWIDSYDKNLFSEDSYWNLKAPIRLIQTHMPSTRVDALGIKSTGPLVSDFNILCLDLFLRTGKHEFVFANSAQLNHQASSPNHLQQNYTIDILTEKDDFKRHELLFPWYNDLNKCILESLPVPRKMDESQLDLR